MFNFKEDSMSSKTRLVTFLLCLFLGWLGVHRFYTGKIGTGFLWLFTGGLFGIGWMVDTILIIFGVFKDKEGREIKKWQ